jgi:hypothetical protein
MSTRLDWSSHAKADCDLCLGSGEVTETTGNTSSRWLCTCVPDEAIRAEQRAYRERHSRGNSAVKSAPAPVVRGFGADQLEEVGNGR